MCHDLEVAQRPYADRDGSEPTEGDREGTDGVALGVPPRLTGLDLEAVEQALGRDPSRLHPLWSPAVRWVGSWGDRWSGRRSTAGCGEGKTDGAERCRAASTAAMGGRRGQGTVRRRRAAVAARRRPEPPCGRCADADDDRVLDRDVRGGKGQAGQTGRGDVALAGLYFFLLPYIWLGFEHAFPTGPEFAVMDIVAASAAALSLVLLYVPRSGRYLRDAGAARQAGA